MTRTRLWLLRWASSISTTDHVDRNYKKGSCPDLTNLFKTLFYFVDSALLVGVVVFQYYYCIINEVLEIKGAVERPPE